MTIAELRGKLAEGCTSGYEYMEVLVTSDVLGAMRYAGWDYVLALRMRTAVRS